MIAAVTDFDNEPCFLPESFPQLHISGNDAHATFLSIADMYS
jgi:hypothetical protein